MKQSNILHLEEPSCLIADQMEGRIMPFKRIRNTNQNVILKTVIICIVLLCAINDDAHSGISGGSVDWVNVEAYDGSGDFSLLFVEENESAAGRIFYFPNGIVDVNNEDFHQAGNSGILIGQYSNGNYIFATAGHAIPTDAQQEIVQGKIFFSFDYQTIGDSNNLREMEFFPVLSLVEHGLADITTRDVDYALLEIDRCNTSPRTSVD